MRRPRHTLDVAGCFLCPFLHLDEDAEATCQHPATPNPARPQDDPPTLDRRLNSKYVAWAHTAPPPWCPLRSRPTTVRFALTRAR